MPTQLTSGSIRVEVAQDPLSPAGAGQLEDSLSNLISAALAAPIGLPELHRCIIPGDRVVLVVDPQTPALPELLASLHEELLRVPEPGLSLGLLLPPDPQDNHWASVRDELPLHLRESASFVCHDPGDLAGNSYIASTEDGQRIYLDNEIAEADLLITVGTICFDQYLGTRGTTSGIFPAMADKDTLERTGLLETRPAIGKKRTARRALVDEVGWLVGAQFSLQIVPAPSGPGTVLAGAPKDVMDAAEPLLNQWWQIQLQEQPEVIVTSIPAGRWGWAAMCQSIAAFNDVLESDSRIIVVADLDEPTGPAAQALRSCDDSLELARRLRKETVVDGVEIGQLIDATNEHRVYLVSSLNAELVEDLGMLPVADQQELNRLLKTVTEYVVIPDACYARFSVG